MGTAAALDISADRSALVLMWVARKGISLWRVASRPMALATTKQRLIASTRVSALVVSSCERNSWKGSMVERASVLIPWRDRAKESDGAGVAFGRSVVLRFGVNVG